MDFMEINQNSCRICLEQTALVDWNEEILDSCSTTYKYCYFRYTQLDEKVADTFSQMCETCSYDLKNFHFLIEKALESHKILLQTFANAFSQPSETDEEIDIKHEIALESHKIQQQIFATTLSQPNKMIEKFDNEEPVKNVEEFETINFENSTESFAKELLELPSAGKTLEICKGTKNERVNKKTKIKLVVTSKKNSKRRENKTHKKKQIKMKKDEGEELIDIPNSENVEQNFEIPRSSPLQDKPLLPQHRKITCAFCPKLIVAQYMKEHERIHKKHRERSFICAKCGLKFFTKKSLNIHMDVHKEDRVKFKCEFCDKSYFHRGACNVHRRIHLGQQVSCPICMREFYRQVDLERHKARVHSASSQDKNFSKTKYLVECKECGKNVPSHRFKHHSALHSNKFQLKCKLCDKDFASKNSCHSHVRKLHKYTGEFANVVEYYGEEINVRYTHLMLKQTETIKPVSEVKETEIIKPASKVKQ